MTAHEILTVTAWAVDIRTCTSYEHPIVADRWVSMRGEGAVHLLLIVPSIPPLPISVVVIAYPIHLPQSIETPVVARMQSYKEERKEREKKTRRRMVGVGYRGGEQNIQDGLGAV
jgi:hypothetical protein